MLNNLPQDQAAEPYPGYCSDEEYSKRFRAKEWFEDGRRYVWYGERRVDIGPDPYLEEVPNDR